MRTPADRHIVTEAMTLPYPKIGQARRARREVPVAVIYELKSRARPDCKQADAPDQPEASRGPMFFWGKSRSIKDDPFLKRLSRLK